MSEKKLSDIEPVLSEAEVFQILTDTADYIAPVQYDPESVSDKKLTDLLRDNIEEDFGVAEVIETSIVETKQTAIAEVKEQSEEDKQIDADFDRARANVDAFLGVAKTATTDLLALARASDNPDVYQALNSMLKTASEINSTLIDNHTKKKKAKMKDPDAFDRQGMPVQNNQQNNFFVGTTAELAAMIKQAQGK